MHSVLLTADAGLSPLTDDIYAAYGRIYAARHIFVPEFNYLCRMGRRALDCFEDREDGGWVCIRATSVIGTGRAHPREKRPIVRAQVRIRRL